MKLSKRLQAIYDLVDEDAVLADIGCDHALLPCALVLNKKIKRAYACDINKEPLKQAMKSIQYYKLEDYIRPVLSDGLDHVPLDVDTIIIAGMGFETVKSILDAHIGSLSRYRKIIVQSNRDVEKLRKYISDHHFAIIEECCVSEDHYYQVLVFHCAEDSALSDREILFGRKMRKDNVYHQMWHFKLKKYETILAGLDVDNERYPLLLDMIKRIKEEIDY